MKKIFFIILFLLIATPIGTVFAINYSTSSTTSAGGSFGLLTPFYLPQDLMNSRTPGTLVVGIYKYSLAIVGVIALGAIIYGAILRVINIGSPSKAKEANDWIYYALLGVVLLFGAYLILNTINPDLVNIEQIDNQLGQNIKPVVLPPPQWSVDNMGTLGLRNAPADVSLAEGDARLYLLDNGGIRGKEKCSVGQSRGCVDLAGVKKGTLDEVIALKKDMKSGGNNSDLFITAGTEGCGSIHSSKGDFNHCTGYKIDLTESLQVNNYIQNNYKPIGKRSDGAYLYQSPRGAVYALENGGQGTGPHWDVLVKN